MRDYYHELYGDADPEEIIADGKSVHRPMQFIDTASSNPEVQRVNDGQRKLAAEREAYQQRISDAWRPAHQPGVPSVHDTTERAVRLQVLESIRDSWFAGTARIPARAGGCPRQIHQTHQRRMANVIPVALG